MAGRPAAGERTGPAQERNEAPPRKMSPQGQVWEKKEQNAGVWFLSGAGMPNHVSEVCYITVLFPGNP